MPPRILVLSASVGAGHLRAAQAVELALRHLVPDADPFPGYRQIAYRRVGPFIVVRYRAARRHRVSLHRATAYRIHGRNAVFFALQPA